MDFRIISLPPFQAATSGVVKDFDFSPAGTLGKFNEYFSSITPCPRDSFMPRDFLCFDGENHGIVWLYALSEGMDNGGYEVVDCEGGCYVTYTYRDGDEETNGRLYQEAAAYIEASEVLELDVRPGHLAMGHIITPPEVIAAQGWAQMEAFIPIKLKRAQK
ncbi:MAG: hypothetical protein K2O45_08000 [Oscillospiraceae bacterium]|nr:hypothetical protein [Oscillospiraceae bacterium]